MVDGVGHGRALVPGVRGCSGKAVTERGSQTRYFERALKRAVGASPGNTLKLAIPAGGGEPDFDPDV